jgi:hypothetical protein
MTNARHRNWDNENGCRREGLAIVDKALDVADAHV